MGLVNLIVKNSKIISNLQSGFIYHYTFLILVFSTLLLSLRQFWMLLGFIIDIKYFYIIFISFFFLLNKSK